MHMHASHGGGERTSRVLRVSLVVTAAYIVLLVVAGIRAHSLALLSEAGHNLSDFFALLLSLTAVYLQSRPPSSTKTYGYHRAGVLAALVNAVSLVAVSGFIFYEAFRRLQNPQQVQAGVMIGVAAAGVVMNGVIALLLYRAGSDVNIRSALLHEIGDTLSTGAVIVGGWIIMATGRSATNQDLALGSLAVTNQRCTQHIGNRQLAGAALLHGAQQLDHFFVFTKPQVTVRKQHHQTRIPRHLLAGLIERFQCRPQLSRLVIRQSQIELHFGKRFQLQCSLILRDRLFVFPGARQSCTKIGPNRGNIRIMLQK